MNDIDDRLRKAGERWRDATAPAPTVDIDRLLGVRPARNLAWFTIAAAGMAAALVFALWRGLPPQPISPGASSTPGASATPVALATKEPLGSPTPRPSYAPGVGGIHIDANPETVRYRVVISASAGSPRSDLSGSVANVVIGQFEPGVRIAVDHTFQPGAVTIWLNGQPCANELDIVEGIELDLVLELAPDDVHSCELGILWQHTLGGVTHPMRGAILSAAVWEGSLVLVRSLDPADAGEAPTRLTAGPRGLDGWEFPIGRYEVSAMLHGELLTTQEVDLTADGGGIYLDLMALPRNVQRDCGLVDQPRCEEAISAALHYGIWVSPDDVVTAVAIGPTTVRSCDPGIEPAYEVEFTFEDGSVSVTVGPGSNGKLAACSPY